MSVAAPAQAGGTSLAHRMRDLWQMLGIVLCSTLPGILFHHLATSRTMSRMNVIAAVLDQGGGPEKNTMKALVEVMFIETSFIMIVSALLTIGLARWLFRRSGQSLRSPCGLGRRLVEFVAWAAVGVSCITLFLGLAL